MNSKKNQKCWNCDHFQRYEEGDEPQDAWGECRKMPLQSKYSTNGGSPYCEHWWPFIDNAIDFWCSEWQKTVQPIPPEPTAPRIPQWPTVWEEWTPWNKKDPMHVECWNCNHFQPTAPTKSLLGECRKFTVPQVVDFDLCGSATGILKGTKSKICGDVRWCGAWERLEGEVPDKPAGICSDKPPSQPHGSVDSMTKAALIEYAEKNDIDINASDTKALILAAIKSA